MSNSRSLLKTSQQSPGNMHFVCMWVVAGWNQVQRMLHQKPACGCFACWQVAPSLLSRCQLVYKSSLPAWKTETEKSVFQTRNGAFRVKVWRPCDKAFHRGDVKLILHHRPQTAHSELMWAGPMKRPFLSLQKFNYTFNQNSMSHFFYMKKEMLL